MLKRLMSLKGKFIFLLAVVFVCFIVLSLFAVYDLKETMLAEKKLKLKHVTEVAYGILEHYQKLVSEGKLSEVDAKATALSVIKSIRYEKVEYFWINDDTLPIPKMVMHPTVPSLDGKVLDAEKFNCAKTMQYGLDGETIKTDGKKNLFQAFNEVVNKAGIGYVTYDWPKPLQGGGTTKEPYPKLSFVKKFEPWRWVIGTGVYIDDVNSAFIKEAMKNLAVALVIVGIIGVAFYFISFNIVRPINRVIEQAEMVAKGDLTGSIEYFGRDELGRLSKAINDMIKQLKSMITNIAGISNENISASGMLQEAAEKIHRGSVEQAEQAHRVAVSAEEMTQTITDIARNASQAAETSEDAMKIANEGKEVAEGAVQTINSVYTSTRELATMVEKLNNRASEIGDIVTVIKDIADQTNLLALNAAIEAARAGEQGRGFAVVADEVRKLAERTIRATAEISEKIGTIQQESEQTATTMEQSSKEVTNATEYIKKVGESLGRIVQSVQRAKDQVTQIAASVEEQSSASEEVARNIEATTKISKDIEKLASEVSSESSKMHHLAKKLEHVVNGFKIQV